MAVGGLGAFVNHRTGAAPGYSNFLSLMENRRIGDGTAHPFAKMKRTRFVATGQDDQEFLAAVAADLRMAAHLAIRR